MSSSNPIEDMYALLNLRLDNMRRAIRKREKSDTLKLLLKENIKMTTFVEDAMKVWDSQNEYMIYVDKISCFFMFESEFHMNKIMGKVFPTWSKVEAYVNKLRDTDPYIRLNNFMVVLPGKGEINPSVTIHVEGNPDFILHNFVSTIVIFREDYSKQLLEGIQNSGDDMPRTSVAIHIPTEFCIKSDKSDDDIETILYRELDKPHHKSPEFIKMIAYSKKKIIDI